jgi:chromosome segregation ATPase
MSLLSDDQAGLLSRAGLLDEYRALRTQLTNTQRELGERIEADNELADLFVKVKAELAAAQRENEQLRLDIGHNVKWEAAAGETIETLRTQLAETEKDVTLRTRLYLESQAQLAEAQAEIKRLEAAQLKLAPPRLPFIPEK